ncbi:hypothetical protein D3C75_739390 [compost metagenome]
MKSCSSFASAGLLTRLCWTSKRTCRRSGRHGMVATAADVIPLDSLCTTNHHTGTFAVWPFMLDMMLAYPVSSGFLGVQVPQVAARLLSYLMVSRLTFISGRQQASITKNAP